MASDTVDPVRRSYLVPQAATADVYAVVVDFAAYPRLFPEFRSTRVLAQDGLRVRVEFRGQLVIPFRYVLDLTCDPGPPSVEWTFVEGEVVSGSAGSWRFVAEGGGTRIDYQASLEVKAPLPGFVLRRITNGLLSASLPAMFASVARETAARRRAAAPPA